MAVYRYARWDAVAVARNRMAAPSGEDLSAMIEANAALGRALSELALTAMRPMKL
jgi:hypothetical protein